MTFRSTFEDHIQQLQQVFDRLRKAGLCLKPKKCFLLHEKFLYLGHEISSLGVRPDSDCRRGSTGGGRILEKGDNGGNKVFELL